MEKDNIIPEGKWEFDENVTRVFGDMLERSIPNYETMRSLVYMIGRNFIKEGIVSDIGCSNGLAIEKFVESFPNTKFVCSDISKPMIQECVNKYKDNSNVSIYQYDLKDGMVSDNNDLVISCLTLQFTPIEYRQDIIQSVYDSLNSEGAFILVEKVLGNSARLDNIFVNEYYNIKRENGYTNELIKSKRKSLEGVLVPLTANFNEHLLRQSGFSKVDCFWRCLNFAGWVAIK